jgi:hypothetical protein
MVVKKLKENTINNTGFGFIRLQDLMTAGLQDNASCQVLARYFVFKDSKLHNGR